MRPDDAAFVLRGAAPCRPDCLLVEGCDFESYPPGGQLAAARQLMSVFGSRLGLVGVSTRGEPVGRWIQRDFRGTPHWFFSVGALRRSSAKPLIPARAVEYVRLVRHREAVLSLGVRAAFVQAPEVLLAVAGWPLDSLCYCFPGVSNPLAISRYRWARPFAGWLDDRLFAALQRADVVFASADARAIDGLVARSRGRLARERVHPLPTSYDARVFAPRARAEARRELGIPDAVHPLVVCTGRLNRAKGWELLLEAAAELSARRGLPGVRLTFVGDGEDRPLLLDRAAHLGIAGAVEVTGFLPAPGVARWVQAADVVAVASRTEGWSVAMVEALACGKPLVSTDVSGAADLIREGANGFVVRSRSPAEFAGALRAALALPDAAAVSLAIARDYTPAALARRLAEHWPALS